MLLNVLSPIQTLIPFQCCCVVWRRVLQRGARPWHGGPPAPRPACRAPPGRLFLSSSCGGCGDTSSAQSRPCVQLLQEIRDSCLQLARLESVSFFLIMGECFCQGKNTVTLPGFLSDRPVSGVSVPICWRVPCAVFALLRPQGRESQGAGDPGNVVGRGV